MTIPTPGRVMLFHPAKDQQTNNFVLPRAGQPLAGIVASVSECGKFVNLMVADASGWPHAKQDVPVIQDDEPAPEGYFAYWMTYQVAKHKSEDAAKKAADAFMEAPRGFLELVPDSSARETRRHALDLAVAFCRDTDFDVDTIAQRYEQYVNGGK